MRRNIALRARTKRLKPILLPITQPFSVGGMKSPMIASVACALDDTGVSRSLNSEARHSAGLNEGISYEPWLVLSTLYGAFLPGEFHQGLGRTQFFVISAVLSQS